MDGRGLRRMTSLARHGFVRISSNIAHRTKCNSLGLCSSLFQRIACKSWPMTKIKNCLSLAAARAVLIAGLLFFAVMSLGVTFIAKKTVTSLVCVVNKSDRDVDMTVLRVPRLSTDYDEVSLDVMSLRNQSKQQMKKLLSTKHKKYKSMMDLFVLPELEESGGHSPCAKLPPTLAGPSQTDTSLVSFRHMVQTFKHLHQNGRFRPRDCQAHQRLAVIIPFRNRKSHLLLLLNNLIPFLSRQQADVTFFLIEQLPGAIFNKGALLNIGYLEALKLGQFDCFIFHDVDLVPLNDKNLYRCGDNPRHFSVAINKFSYSLAYKGNFGGVVGLSMKQYSEVNGNSNLYIGWGGEDDDLLERVTNKGYFISRYSGELSKYDMVNHSRDKGNEPNPFRVKLLELARVRQEVDGLNSIHYSIHYNRTIKDMALFTLITVDIDNDRLLSEAPDFIQDILSSIDTLESES
ncbi:beta-1,4-galactosyltransferase 4-like [Biomphalaria glabrata]|uniref:Beta-1,4-galactosyltransferase n=1 Tax=Biomphalaria glabrata TaxID=6526 RepID=A0A9W3AXU0_BIOGL|nr:beta-1,4-galactosyltransferase 4-like [Biomphalaria glabrata]